MPRPLDWFNPEYLKQPTGRYYHNPGRKSFGIEYLSSEGNPGISWGEWRKRNTPTKNGRIIGEDVPTILLYTPEELEVEYQKYGCTEAEYGGAYHRYANLL